MLSKSMYPMEDIAVIAVRKYKLIKYVINFILIHRVFIWVGAMVNIDIDIDSFALYIGIKPGYLARLYYHSEGLGGLKLPKRNFQGKIKMSEAISFKKELDNKCMSHLLSNSFLNDNEK